MPDDAPAYRERLRVPWSWWWMAAGVTVTVWLAFVVGTPWVFATTVALLVAAGLALALHAYGSVSVVVDEGGLYAGRACLAWRYVGAARALDEPATRRMLGVDADARAHLVLRSYCRTAVMVEVEDIDDPAPYWLVSSRHPDDLARRLQAHDMRD